MDMISSPKLEPEKLEGDTPTMRLFALLEVIAEKDQLLSLQALVEETGLPKPTLHRMLQQLESVGVLQRESDGRHYSTGVRLRRLASNLLINNTFHGARRMVLRKLQPDGLQRQRSGVPGQGGNGGPAALLPASRLEGAGPLLVERQAVPGAN